MAGYRVYAFKWGVFADLALNSCTDLHKQLAHLLSTAKIRRRLQLPPTFPKAKDDLEVEVRSLLREPDWYVGQSVSDVTLRHKLLFAMFFNEDLRDVGVAATPACREFRENCSFDLGAVLAGRMVLDHERMKNDGGRTIKSLLQQR